MILQVITFAIIAEIVDGNALVVTQQNNSLLRVIESTEIPFFFCVRKLLASAREIS